MVFFVPGAVAGRLARAAGVALVWLCLLPGLQPATAQSLRTAAQRGVPVKYAPGNAERPGLCSEVMDLVEQIDPGLRFSGRNQSATLRRVELMLERGEIDVFFCLLDTPERRRRFDYLSVPLYRIRPLLVQRAEDRSTPLTLAELAQSSRGRPVLVAQGSVLAQMLARAGVTINDGANSDEAALRMLALGRVDFVFGQDMTLLPLLHQPEFAGRLRVSEGSLFEIEPHYAVVGRHVSKILVQRLETALQTLERQGRLRALAEKYQLR